MKKHNVFVAIVVALIGVSGSLCAMDGSCLGKRKSPDFERDDAIILPLKKRKIDYGVQGDPIKKRSTFLEQQKGPQGWTWDGDEDTERGWVNALRGIFLSPLKRDIVELRMKNIGGKRKPNDLKISEKEISNMRCLENLQTARFHFANPQDPRRHALLLQVSGLKTVSNIMVEYARGVGESLCAVSRNCPLESVSLRRIDNLSGRELGKILHFSKDTLKTVRIQDCFGHNIRTGFEMLEFLPHLKTLEVTSTIIDETILRRILKVADFKGRLRVNFNGRRFFLSDEDPIVVNDDMGRWCLEEIIQNDKNRKKLIVRSRSHLSINTFVQELQISLRDRDTLPNLEVIMFNEIDVSDWMLSPRNPLGPPSFYLRPLGLLGSMTLY